MKLNLGGGFRYLPGWVQVDIIPDFHLSHLPSFIRSLAYSFSGARKLLLENQPFTKEKYLRFFKECKPIYHDLRKGIPYPDNSVEEIYISHVLEHFSKAEGRKLLEEIYRVLEPRGLVRISVPNLELAFSTRNLEIFYPTPTNFASCHKWMYDFESLSKALWEIGFWEIGECKFWGGQSSAILLDISPEQSLFIEAIK